MNYKKLQFDIRIFILEAIHNGKSSHVGSSLSCVDILIAQMQHIKNNQKTEPLDTINNIILSKGHATSAFYGLIHSSCEDSTIYKNKYYQNTDLFFQKFHYQHLYQ